MTTIKPNRIVKTLKFLFMYWLLKNANVSSDYIASNGRMLTR